MKPTVLGGELVVNFPPMKPQKMANQPQLGPLGTTYHAIGQNSQRAFLIKMTHSSLTFHWRIPKGPT
jgi:hypothetical protein